MKKKNLDFASNTPDKAPEASSGREWIGARRRRHLKVLTVSALLAALSVILGYYTAIHIGDSIRIGFGAIPILAAGLLFGPWAGMAVGLVSDLVGCAAFFGFGALNPLVTLSVVAEGCIIGLFSKNLTTGRVVGGIALAHTVGSVILKSFGLWVYYRTPWETLLLRPLIAACEIVIASVVLAVVFCKNRVLTQTVRWLRAR